MSKVNRSTYQKAIEETRRLRRDIFAIVHGDDKVREWWIMQFRKERQEDEELRRMVLNWMKENPNDPAVIAVNKLTQDYEHRKPK